MELSGLKYIKKSVKSECKKKVLSNQSLFVTHHCHIGELALDRHEFT